jgi:hypothetical protein
MTCIEVDRPHAAPPSADQATASQADPPDPTATPNSHRNSSLPEVLRRPVEPALGADAGVMDQTGHVYHRHRHGSGGRGDAPVGRRRRRHGRRRADLEDRGVAGFHVSYQNVLAALAAKAGQVSRR